MIAHFSRPRAYAFALAWLIVLGLGTLAVLYHPAGTTWRTYLESNGAYRSYYAVGFFIVAPFLALRMSVILFSLLFRESAAIWANGGYVYFIDTWWFGLISKFRIEDLRAASASTWRNTNWPSVSISLGSSARDLPAWLLREPAGDIAVRLQSLNQRSH
jgi:hypothetical protein